jgi:acyl dehydratase
MLAAASGERMRAHHNIHTDEAYALSQGLPAAIADGMLSTNWISSLLIEVFGAAYIEAGERRTKYIKPVFVGVPVRARALVTTVDRDDDGSLRVALDVWAEDPDGVHLTVGDARVTLAFRPAA